MARVDRTGEGGAYYGGEVVASRARYPQLLALGPPPTLVGHECGKCGRRAFPPDPYGCEKCGADSSELIEVELTANGRVHAVAEVHRHHHPRPETPFSVATIVLDEGISIKAVIEPTEGRTVIVGDRVGGVIVPWETDEDGTEVVDLRFALASEEGA